MSVDKTLPITVVAEAAKLPGEDKTTEPVHGALNDPRAHAVDTVMIGQCLQPTPHHYPVLRYWTSAEFDALADYGQRLGFQHVASGPLVRSSYHTDRMAHEAGYVEVA